MGNIPECPYENLKKLEGILTKWERDISSAQRKIEERKEEKIQHENTIRELQNKLEDTQEKLAEILEEEEREQVNDRFHATEEELEKSKIRWDQADFGIHHWRKKKSALLGRKSWLEERIEWVKNVIRRKESEGDLTHKPFQNLTVSSEE